MVSCERDWFERHTTMTFWIVAGFLTLVLFLVVLDLGLLTRRPKQVTATEAALSAQLWLVGAIGLGILLFRLYDIDWIPLSDPLRREPVALDALLQYLTAYVIEVALSLDNIVVLVLLFAHFKIPHENRGRVLFWVLLGCLISRAGMVAVGASILSYEWTRWLFVALLIIAAFRTFVLPDRPADLDDRPFVRAAKRTFGQNRSIAAVVMVAVLADLSFALDSIPAVFSVTRDPLIAFTSNVMAVLALRSLYFSLQNVISRIRYLKVGLVVMLLGLATKIAFFGDTLLPTAITIGSILGVLGASVLASIPHMRKQARMEDELPAPIEDAAEAIAATRRNLRKLAVLVVGTLVLLGAIAVGPLPGPGFTILAPIGIAILATEFAWARGLLGKLKFLQDKTDEIANRTSVWLVPFVVVGFWAVLGLVAYFTHTRYDWDMSIVFVLAGGGFMPIGFWAYRKIVIHFWGLPVSDEASRTVEIVVVRQQDISDRVHPAKAVSSSAFTPSPF
jgi:tellurite resistance protein TerC